MLRVHFPTLLLVPLLALCLVSACTARAPEPSTAPARVQGRVFPLEAPFLPNVDRIEVLRYDRARGATWSAEFRRSRTAAGAAEWTITRAPDGIELADRRADSAYLEKLLDLFSTLTIRGVAGKAPLAELGLEPPAFSFRLRAGDAPARELQFGDVGQDGAFAYARLLDEPGQTIWEAQGATLPFLAMIDSFDYLRDRRVLSPWKPDDVDVLRLSRGGAVSLEAEREGTRWLRPKVGRVAPEAPEAGEKLEALTHLRARAFIDDPKETARLEARYSKARPTFTAELTHRKDALLKLDLFRESDGRLLARASHRKGAWFELHPESARQWEPGSGRR